MTRISVVGTEAEQAVVLEAVLFWPNEGDVEERHVRIGELKAEQLDDECVIIVALRTMVLCNE